MLRPTLALVFLLSIFSAAAAFAAAPLTLEDCFRAALRRSETVGIQVDQINIAEENYKQAIGAILPSVTGYASYLRQPVPADAPEFFPASQPLVRITADQPLFRGLREIAGLRQTKDLRQSQVEATQNARMALWESVAQNFYNILSYERDLDDLSNESKLYLQRIRDLNAWLRIGRARQTDVLTVQSSLASLNATIEQDRGLLAAAREAFAFLTGLPAGTPIADTHALSSAVAPLDSYLARLEDRPDVKSVLLQQHAAEENIKVTEGQRWPSIDLIGDYYPYRYGVTSSVNWDIQLTLSVPLYTGGTIGSKVRQAASQEHQSELSLSQTRRTAGQEIRTAYVTYSADQRQINVLRFNREIAERNYKAETIDYRRGLVTNLDVLTALTSFVEAERSLDRVIFTSKYDLTHLQTAAMQNAAVNSAKGP